jgi:hypothetical protein
VPPGNQGALLKLETMSHTPGPWMVTNTIGEEGIAKSYPLIMQKKMHGANVAKVIPCVGLTEEEVTANAMLIKAAPKMQAVLIEIDEYLSRNKLNSIGSNSILHDIVREAIAHSKSL